MLRTFVALGIGEQVRRRLVAAQEQLKAAKARVTWVPAENLHVTVKFLGDVAEQRVSDIASALAKAARGIEPFVMSVQGLGAFPNLRRPRVIWAGLGEGAEQAARLAEAVERELEPLGFEADARPFSSHITLGRVRSAVGISALTSLVQQQRHTQFGSAPAEQVALMKSELRPTGVVYSVLHALPLGP